MKQTIDKKDLLRLVLWLGSKERKRQVFKSKKTPVETPALAVSLKQESPMPLG